MVLSAAKRVAKSAVKKAVSRDSWRTVKLKCRTYLREARNFTMVRTNDLNRLIQTENWSMVLVRCRSHPEETKSWGFCPGCWEGKWDADLLPLHQACMLKPPADVVEALVSAHPKSAKSRESGYKRLALHLACMSGVGPDVIRALLAQYPDAATTPDKFGRVPLHYACKCGAPLAVVEALLEARPDATKCFDDANGWLPLHVALSCGSAKTVVKALLHADPRSSTVCSRRGNDPTHFLKKSENIAEKSEITTMLAECRINYQRTVSELVPSYPMASISETDGFIAPPPRKPHANQVQPTWERSVDALSSQAQSMNPEMAYGVTKTMPSTTANPTWISSLSKMSISPGNPKTTTTTQMFVQSDSACFT